MKSKIIPSGGLRAALNAVQLAEGFKELAGGETALDAVLHVIEGEAVYQSLEAGLPHIAPDEAKACARAASELRNTYSKIQMLAQSAIEGDISAFKE